PQICGSQKRPKLISLRWNSTPKPLKATQLAARLIDESRRIPQVSPPAAVNAAPNEHIMHAAIAQQIKP
ncbi:jg13005, partial [Pararge aegeria aegeria]